MHRIRDIEPRSLAYVPNHFKTQEMCYEAVRNKLCILLFVPDDFKTMEICNEIMRAMLEAFHRIPNCFKTQGMSVEVDPSSLQLVSDRLKGHEMCNKAVRG